MHVRQILSLAPSCCRAACELALARVRHQFVKPGDVEAMNRRARQLTKKPAAGAGPPSPDAQEWAQHIAFVLPRVATRLPWRADCLIQAMAAQRWLGSKGAPATISIGVRRGETGAFESHAWLLYGDRVVTGGDISGYSPILTADTRFNAAH